MKTAPSATHGGHGTLMRCLSQGVPMVLIPGLAHDQATNAAIMQQWGTGVALASDAGSSAIREAARQVLSTNSYRQNAQLRSSWLKRVDGAKMRQMRSRRYWQSRRPRALNIRVAWRCANPFDRSWHKPHVPGRSDRVRFSGAESSISLSIPKRHRIKNALVNTFNFRDVCNGQQTSAL